MRSKFLESFTESFAITKLSEDDQQKEEMTDWITLSLKPRAKTTQLHVAAAIQTEAAECRAAGGSPANLPLMSLMFKKTKTMWKQEGDTKFKSIWKILFLFLINQIVKKPINVFP